MTHDLIAIKIYPKEQEEKVVLFYGSIMFYTCFFGLPLRTQMIYTTIGQVLLH